MPMPRKILETTVVTTVTLKAKLKPNKMTDKIIMEVTGLTLGKACKPIRDAILKADNKPIKATRQPDHPFLTYNCLH